jgi:transcriptional regulator with XRE-family HTH domain
MTTTNIEQDLAEQLATLGRKIRATREFRKLTQTKVSDMASIGLQTYLRIEDGHAGIGALNLAKVLRVLDMDESMMPAALPDAPEMALHARHRDSEPVCEAIEEAVKAACESLDAFFSVKYPERDGITSNFQGLLRDHVTAMLCGEHGVRQRYATHLPRLLYSDDSVGGPRWTEEKNHGWVLRVRGTQKVLHDGRVVPLTHSELDPWASREYALDGFRKSIERYGHPPGPVDAVPVYLSTDDKYNFTPPAVTSTSVLTDHDELKLKQLLEYVAEHVRLGSIPTELAADALSTVYRAIDADDTAALSPWLESGPKILDSASHAASGSAWSWGTVERSSASSMTEVDNENLIGFLRHATSALRAGEVSTSAFSSGLFQFFGALDDGNRAEVQNWLKQGRKLLASIGQATQRK